MNRNRSTEPNTTIKSRFYESYFAPYLKLDPQPSHLGYFYDQAWNAWRLGISKQDKMNMLFIEWICSELFKKNPQEFKLLIASVIENSHDALVRIEQSEKTYFESGSSDDIAERFSHSLRHYKVFFESELRLWITIPYYFACKIYGIKTKCTTIDSYINLPASEKFQKLKGIKTPLAQGFLPDLIRAFDNEIRNAGEGHDSYEITDKNTAILHVIDPKSGLHSGSQTIELSIEELKGKIDNCRKAIWVLENGMMVFITNNPSVVIGVARNKPLKNKEIEALVSDFAEERWLEMDNFTIESNSLIKIKLRYFKKKMGVSRELLLGNGERYELIDVETTVMYQDQVLGILQYFFSIWDRGVIPTIEVSIFEKEGKELANLKYEKEELIKLTKGKSAGIPKPSLGKMPDKSYIMVSSLRVPYGSRDFMEKMLKTKGYKIHNG